MAWSECNIDKQSYIIGVTECVDNKNGKVEYKTPIFKAFNLKKELIEKAIQTDKMLKKYFEAYKSQVIENEIQKEVVVEQSIDDDTFVYLNEETNTNDDLPF
jgi:hypothetical protein